MLTHASSTAGHTVASVCSSLPSPALPPQVTGVFARRGYNVQSLAVGACEKHNLSRICMVVPGTEESIQKLFKQLSKLVYVQSMTDLTHMPFLYRELMLVKVRVWTGRKVCRYTPCTNHTRRVVADMESRSGDQTYLLYRAFARRLTAFSPLHPLP